MFALFLLAAVSYGQYKFGFDSLVVNPYRPERSLPYAGTGCRLYVKHGKNPAIWRDDNVANPVYDTDSGDTTSMFWFEFPETHEIHIDSPTWFWTTCADGFIVDFMELVTPQGTKRFGADNDAAWCMSLEGNAADRNAFNRWAREASLHSVSIYSATLLYGNEWVAVPFDDCYSWIELPGGVGMTGVDTFHDDQSTPKWMEEGTEPGTVSVDGRRNLQAAASLEAQLFGAVKACEMDPEATDDECLVLVELMFQIKSKKPYERTPIRGVNIEEYARLHNYVHDEEQTEAESLESDSEDSSNDQSLVRRLLQKYGQN